jgi:hypothetical protein
VNRIACLVLKGGKNKNFRGPTLLSFTGVPCLRHRNRMETGHCELTVWQHIVAVTLLDLHDLVNPADSENVGDQCVVDAANEAGHELKTHAGRGRSRIWKASVPRNVG